MMITFEHEAPADNRYFLKAVNAGEGDKPQPEPNIQLAEADEAMVDAPQTAPIQASPIQTTPAQVEPAKKAPVKHRLVSHRTSPKAKTMIQRASYHSNSPLGCCFRGNYS
ncbi:hypothetical protein [Methylophilus sp. 3sh_L]|uniref:hypothetical protein n=1 Tax=Methylophilus sp. 3sh_L TaxID=3377114 RepID=UPI00398F2343